MPFLSPAGAGATPLDVQGGVTVTNTPSVPVPVSGTLAVATGPSSPLYVTPPVPVPVTPAAATLVGNQDNTVALGQTCGTYFIQNNLVARTIHFTIDGSAAGLGSPAIGAGGYASADLQTSVLHVYPEGSASVALNTAAVLGVWIQGGA